MLKVTIKSNNNFSKFKKNLEELSKRKTVSFDELFTMSFLKNCSSFNNFEDLISNSPFEVKTKEDFFNIPDDEWDSYIKSVTTFNSWKDMQISAHNFFVKNKLAI